MLDLELPHPPEPGLDAAQLGSLLHAILEEVYKQAQDPADPNSVLAEVEEVTQRLFATAPEEYGFRPAPVWEVEKEYLVDRVEEAIHVLAEDPGWRPTAFERFFGSDENPFELDTPDGAIRLRGLIDRVDTNANGQLRVVDYKTGASGTKQRRPAPRPAAAAADLRPRGLIWPWAWAHRSTACITPSWPGKAGSLKLAKFKFDDGERELSGPEGALEIAREHAGQAVQGRAEWAVCQPVPPQGGCPSYCPASAWCWHYNPSAW